MNLDCLTYAGRLENLSGVDADPRYVFEKTDLRDAAEVTRVIRQHDITHVLHLAAETHVDRSIRGPADFIQTNIVGTFHLLEACRAHWLSAHPPSTHIDQCFRFVHVSTDEVYGSLEHTGSFTESSPYAPNSPYSASKAASDHWVRSYHRTYGLPAIITNSSNNYGPRQFPEKLIPLVIQRLLQRQPIPIYGDGLHVRDWLHVEDHCQALWTILKSGRVGQSYNIGAQNEVTNLALVETLCDLIDELRPDLGGQSRQLITFVTDRPGHDRRYAIDASKLRSELGWTPQHTFSSGLRQTLEWYLRHQSWLSSASAHA